mmetsp:Transcript_2637/g.7202  ORF Transcript_2637/g.7202 Transcript_2637/m.7202 type:complete len:92 (+) Transcript_2637:287-562(+)
MHLSRPAMRYILQLRHWFSKRKEIIDFDLDVDLQITWFACGRYGDFATKLSVIPKHLRRIEYNCQEISLQIFKVLLHPTSSASMFRAGIPI